MEIEFFSLAVKAAHISGISSVDMIPGAKISAVTDGHG
jgi:hypothetical protein